MNGYSSSHNWDSGLDYSDSSVRKAFRALNPQAMAVCNVRALEVAATGRSLVMSLVYRIQSKQDRTRGAYRAHRKLDNKPNVVHQMENTHCGSWDGHPTPKADTGIERFINQNEHCGFNTAAALLRWFRGFIPDLLRAGYEIVALRDVTVTAVGEFQVLFTFDD